MRMMIKLTAFLILLCSVFILYDRYDMRAPAEFEVLGRIDPQPHTKALIEQERWLEAEVYLSFFSSYDYVKENPQAQKLLADIKTHREELSYKSKKVIDGVLRGKSDELEGQVAAGVSDLFLFGDIRDLAIEGYHHVRDQEVDKVLVALSSIGVAATAATWMSGGAAAPIKGSLSFLKFAKKSGKMPNWLGKYLIKSSKEIKKTKDLTPMKSFFTDTYELVKNSGVTGGLKLLGATSDLKTFQNALSFSKTFGKNSAVLVDIAGKDIIKISQKNVSKETFLHAATYGKPGIKRVTKLGEKRFLNSLVKPVKISRVGKIFDKNMVHMLNKIPDMFFIVLGVIALAVLV